MFRTPRPLASRGEPATLEALALLLGGAGDTAHPVLSARLIAAAIPAPPPDTATPPSPDPRAG